MRWILDPNYNYNYNAGTSNYLRTAHPSIWTLAMSDHSCDPPMIYSEQFYRLCAQKVSEQFGLDLCKDISVHNCIEVYLYLISCV